MRIFKVHKGKNDFFKILDSLPKLKRECLGCQTSLKKIGPGGKQEKYCYCTVVGVGDYAYWHEICFENWTGTEEFQRKIKENEEKGIQNPPIEEVG